ncbi:polysaccharide deacetylase family protein, partial [Bacillus sp. JJ722]|uniref:polysaccharide deacetylase family protein n=1 Tax=Bacillus sp. JJ722 TaxID=3122973 RepID=UPI002FFFFDF0
KVVQPVRKSSFNSPTNAVEIPVLMYHHFDKEIKSGTIANPTIFHEQMKILKRAGYTTVTEEDVIADYNGEKKLPKNPIMITLDDGYVSNYEYVFPILKELNMKATIFIITDFIENPQNHPSPYPKLTWEQLREMSDSGLVSFQSHTDNRHSRGINGKNTADAEYEKHFLADLLKSKRILEERLGKPVTAFSYPNGEYSEVSEQIVKKAGFEMSFTTEPGMLDTSKNSLFRVNRINIHGNASAEFILNTIEKLKKI